jgi:hypothetical protein
MVKRSLAKTSILLAVTAAGSTLLASPASAHSATHSKSRSAAPAAVTCGPSAPDRDPGTAYTTNYESGFSGPAMRTGPGGNCTLLTRVPWGNTVSLNCWRIGDTVNGVSTWSAVHYGGYFGWISDYYLSGRGSNYAC